MELKLISECVKSVEEHAIEVLEKIDQQEVFPLFKKFWTDNHHKAHTAKVLATNILSLATLLKHFINIEILRQAEIDRKYKDDPPF